MAKEEEQIKRILQELKKFRPEYYTQFIDYVSDRGNRLPGLARDFLTSIEVIDSNGDFHENMPEILKEIEGSDP